MSNAIAESRAAGRLHRQVAHVWACRSAWPCGGGHADTAAGREAWTAVINQLREVDRIFSTYRDDSIISRLGRGELAIDDCPAEVADVLALGRVAEEQSVGAFSIFLPSADGRRRLNPNGVVKGWAARRASGFLAALDDTDFCLSAGGDIVCHTASTDRLPWRIGIEDPGNPKRLIAMVPIRSGAVATSGTAHRGAHLLDPRTGQPAIGVASVTVVAASLTWEPRPHEKEID